MATKDAHKRVKWAGEQAGATSGGHRHATGAARPPAAAPHVAPTAMDPGAAARKLDALKRAFDKGVLSNDAYAKGMLRVKAAAAASVTTAAGAVRPPSTDAVDCLADAMSTLTVSTGTGVATAARPAPSTPRRSGTSMAAALSPDDDSDASPAHTLATSGSLGSPFVRGPCLLTHRKPLRDYQRHLVNDFEASVAPFGAGGRSHSAMVYLPTGAGKTRLAAELIGLYHARGKRSLFVVNRNALVAQTHAALQELGLGDAVGFIKANYEPDSSKPIQIASIQSLRSRRRRAIDGGDASGAGDGDGGADSDDDSPLVARAAAASTRRPWPVADLVVIDEAHCAIAQSYMRLCDHYAASGACLLGLSATPMRRNPDEDLSAVFHKLLRGPSVSTLVRRGILAPPLVYGVREGDVLSTLSDDYSDNKIGARALEKLQCAGSVNAAVESWGTHAAGRRTLAFAVTIEHSLSLVKAFRRDGVKAAHVDGTTSKRERAEMYRRFADGNITVLSSVNVLSEGFDDPGVECVMLLRPTRSKGLYIQQVGRGLRCFPGKSNCIILDQSGNTWMHGSVTGPVGYAWEEIRSLAPTEAQGPKVRVMAALGVCNG